MGKVLAAKRPELCQLSVPRRVNGHISFFLSAEVKIEKALSS